MTALNRADRRGSAARSASGVPRSADSQSAVSPIFNRQTLLYLPVQPNPQRLQVGSIAIRHTGSLRYKFRDTFHDSSRSARRSPCAFTLTELLVVIAIIGVLAALLLPALARANASAGRLECISRLKQWNVAFRLYAEDNDGWIVRECYEPLGEVTINNWSQAKAPDANDVWYNALPRLLDQSPTTNFAALTLSQRRKFFDTRHLIHCPAARFPRHAFLPTYQFPLFSLAMNSQLIQSGPTIRFNVMEERDPARTVVFLDNMLDGEAKVHSEQESAHLGQPGAYANRFGARHQQGGNLAFADGHVNWFHGRDVVETDNASPLVGGPILPPRDIVWEIYPF